MSGLTSRTLGLLILAASTSLPTAVAQDEFLPAADVRASADRILSEPEFRYFEHFSEDGQLRGRKSGSGSEAPARSPAGDARGSGKGKGASGRQGASGQDDKPGNGPAPPGDQPGPQPAAGQPAETGPAPKTPRPTRDRTRSRPKADEDSGGPKFNIPDIGLGGFASALGHLLQGLAYVGIALAVVLIVYLVVRAVASWERRKPGGSDVATGDVSLFADDRSPGETPADQFIRQALELAAAGQFREAIAQLLLGGMSRIERERLIRYRRGLTFRDYLRVLRGNQSAYGGFRAMVDQYEPVNFGRREATRDSFDIALDGYRTGFPQEATL
ncbi:MAG TPA: hypothetical protein VL132_19665 [Planctomycetaceae bacterium]|nr:hypothetical protein [Planctomycetaceae bacterium]